MKKLILFLIVTSLLVTSCDNDKSSNVVTIGGELFMAGEIKIPVLAGSYNNMGQQLGTLMGDDISQLYQAMVTEGAAELGLDFESLSAEAEILWDTVFPVWLQELCAGLSVTSGLTLEQIKVLQAYPVIIEYDVNCSVIILWGEYTLDGGLLFGRNLDDSTAVSFSGMVCVTVYKPDDGGHQFASIGFPGVFPVYSGVNDEGLCTAQNGAPMADVFNTPNLTQPWRSIKSFEWLRDYETLGDLETVYLNTPASVGCNYLAADTGTGICYETATDLIREREPDSTGLICETNHFVHPDLLLHTQMFYGSDTTSSTFIRRANLLNLAETYKGMFTMSTLIDSVLLVSEYQGGVMNNTVESYVIRPSDLTMIIAAPGLISTVTINLNDYFD